MIEIIFGLALLKLVVIHMAIDFMDYYKPSHRRRKA